MRLSEAKFDDGSPLETGSVQVNTEEFGNTRLYWKRLEYRVEFLCLDFVSAVSTDPLWGPDTEVENLFYGWGSNADEGIRHLFLGPDDNRGYIYYPDTPNLCAALTRVHELINAA